MPSHVRTLSLFLASVRILFSFSLMSVHSMHASILFLHGSIRFFRFIGVQDRIRESRIKGPSNIFKLHKKYDTQFVFMLSPTYNVYL
jgi:hypothetical protein